MRGGVGVAWREGQAETGSVCSPSIWKRSAEVKFLLKRFGERRRWRPKSEVIAPADRPSADLTQFSWFWFCLFVLDCVRAARVSNSCLIIHVSTTTTFSSVSPQTQRSGGSDRFQPCCHFLYSHPSVHVFIQFASKLQTLASESTRANLQLFQPFIKTFSSFRTIRLRLLAI